MSECDDCLGAADLEQPYRPVAIHYVEADVLEWVERDVPSVLRPVQAGLDVVLDMKTREPIGWRIYGWSKVAPC